MAVPKLRFKEFEGDWDRKKLSILFDKITTKNTLGKCDNVISNSAQYGLVSQRNFFFKDIANAENTSNYYVIEHDDFVYNPRKSKEAPYGPFNRYMCKDTGIVSPLYTCIRRKSLDNLDFLMFYFKSGMWHRYMYSNGNTGVRHDRVSVTDDMLMKLPVSLPHIDEQQKIADFLTTFDKRIAAQQNIIADLEETKKGLLQKIFNQEIRFKDDNGQDYPDWKDKRLGAICQIFKGAPLSKSDISAEGKPFILYGELYTTYSEVTYDIVRKTRTSVDERYYSEVGDVLVPTSGESAEEISTATCVMQKGVILAGDLNVVRSNVIDGRILSYMLNHTKKHDLSRVAQGISVVHSKAEDLKKLIISIPAVEEQQKIAAFLSTFDKKITAERQILSDLKEIKKGLLQQMFV